MPLTKNRLQMIQPGGDWPAAATQPTPSRTILLTAMGTRGDVQPFVALGLHLTHARGWRVVLAVPPEYRSFVEGYGLQAENIGISLQHAVSSSPQGRALRTANAFTAFRATRDFFRLPLLESWFASIQRLLSLLHPDVLLLSGFVAMSGAAALPSVLGLPTRVVLAYTIPMMPTAAFGMPLAGTGFSAPAGWLNRLQWDTLDVAVSQRLHRLRAQQIVDGAVVTAMATAATDAVQAGVKREIASAFRSLESPTSIIWGCNGDSMCSSPSTPQHSPTTPVGGIKLQRSLTPGPTPTLYIYSPSLLPKPDDWPDHGHVVGALLLRRRPPRQEVANAAGLPGAGKHVMGASTSVGLPAALQDYLSAAVRQQLPVVYIGLGSMLGTVFEPAEVQRLIGCMEEAVLRVSHKMPLCAVIHTTLQPGSNNGDSSSSDIDTGGSGSTERRQLSAQALQQPGSGHLPPYLTLKAPVPHELLLPQCDLVVHHGGAGTMQASLLAGKPSLVVPCVPSSDQPFWADLVQRRGLGPAWFPVRRLTAARLAAGIEAGLHNLDQYTAAAEALAYKMAQEDGVAAAADVIEATLSSCTSGQQQRIVT